MKKRLLSILMAAALLVTALAGWAGAATYDNVYFMALNDTLYPVGYISDSIMPVRTGGVLYVPYTVLDPYYTNVDLGLLYNYNRSLSTFTIYNRQRMLTFHINDATCTDMRGNSLNHWVIARNGTVYIPIAFVSEYFGLTCTVFQVEVASGTVNMVRIRNSDSVWSDREFAGAASFLLDEPLSDYLKSKVTPSPTITQTPTVTPTPTPGVTPTPPVTSPGPGDTTPEPTPDKSGVSVYFAIRCTGENDLTALLQYLTEQDLRAIFLFPPDQLAQLDDQVRAAIALGHQVGLLLDSDGDPQAQFDAGNELLRHIARARTRVVSFTGQTAEGDWSVWTDNTGQVLDSTSDSTVLSTAALRAIDRADTVARLTLDDSPRSLAALRVILRSLREDGYAIQNATETTLP